MLYLVLILQKVVPLKAVLIGYGMSELMSHGRDVLPQHASPEGIFIRTDAARRTVVKYKTDI